MEPDPLIPPTVYIEYDKERSGNIVTRSVLFIMTTNYGLDSLLLYAYNQDTILYHRRQWLSERHREPGTKYYSPDIDLDYWNIAFTDSSKLSDSIQIIGTIIDVNGLSASDTTYVTIGEF